MIQSTITVVYSIDGANQLAVDDRPMERAVHWKVRTRKHQSWLMSARGTASARFKSN